MGVTQALFNPLRRQKRPNFNTVGAAPDNITAFPFFIRDICLRTTPRDTSRAKMLAFRRNTISEAKISVPPRRFSPDKSL